MAARRLRPSTSVARREAGDRYEWNIASQVQAIDAVVSELVSICRTAGFSGRQCRLNIPVAVTEALSNAVVKGNCSDCTCMVRVSALVTNESLSVEVTDEGPGFDPSAKLFCPEDSNWLEREDGRGLFLMRSLMDDVQYRCEASPSRGHTVRLVLHRA